MDKTAARFADYAAALTWNDLSPRAIHCATRSIVDSFGCALGAFNAPLIAALRAMASEITSTRPATVIGTRIRSAADSAGFVNAAMVRYLDFSDDYFGGNGKQAGPHPSDNIGCLLAAAESTGADARTFMLGMVLAYEVCDQLVDHTLLHPQGWDYTVMHAAATALGAGKILGLNREQLSHALGLAVVANISLWQTRVGVLSNWKGLAGPNGSRNGLFAALLARRGITGPAEPFEGRCGFMRQLDNRFELGELGGAGAPFRMERTFYKSLPVMYSAQLPIATALELRRTVAVEEIESLVLYVYQYMLSTGAYAPERWQPSSHEMADHSSPYLVAAALVDGEITARTMTPERYRSPEILAVARKLRVEEDPQFTAAYPQAQNCRLEAKLRNGKVVSAQLTNPRGHPDNPMSDDELSAKFLRQACGVLPEQQSRNLLDTLWNIERVDNLSRLIEQTVVEHDRG